ncbi:transporter substrate-binding domain-containing protein, partial [Myxococcota bacterium]|nr:transporter substrate-binding domain-containing protein [Myxococcota bacterium]
RGVFAPRGDSFPLLAFVFGVLLSTALMGSCACSPPAETLIVATSGDYPPFSQITKNTVGGPEGYGPDLIRAYARDRGIEIRFVPFRWPTLLEDLRAERFDVAVGGITIRSERILAGRFSVPVAQSGAIALVNNASPWREVSDLDHPAVRIAVNRGGHLERVTRENFPRAQVLTIEDNGRVLDELIAQRAEAVVTDTLEAPLWQVEAPATRALGPFTQDQKAFLLPADRSGLASDLDRWLMKRAQAGDLSQWRTRTLGPQQAQPETALPWPALLAALDARLSLMPAVAEAKRRSGAPVEDPAREQRVLEAAIESNRPTEGFNSSEARRKALFRLFRAQIEAAKAVQVATLAKPPAPEFEDEPPDLNQMLRPALIRIGEQISQRVVALPPDIDPQMVRQNLQDTLSDYALEERLVEDLAAGLLAVAQSNGSPEVQ